MLNVWYLEHSKGKIKCNKLARNVCLGCLNALPPLALLIFYWKSRKIVQCTAGPPTVFSFWRKVPSGRGSPGVQKGGLHPSRPGCSLVSRVAIKGENPGPSHWREKGIFQLICFSLPGPGSCSFRLVPLKECLLGPSWGRQPQPLLSHPMTTLSPSAGREPPGAMPAGG